MDYKNPEKEFQHAFNNKFGQKYFKESVPDLYSAKTKEAFYLNGCFYHAHFENCLLNKNVKSNSFHPFGQTYEAINKQFEEKLVSLITNHPNEVLKVTIAWECQFLNDKKSKDEVKYFFDNIFVPHPLRRLTPRDSVRGAFTDVYRLKWNQSEHPNEKFFCADINGLYSYCAINFKYMKGKYDILIGKSLQNINIVNNKFLLDGHPIMGAILLMILPPKDLFTPFLLHKKKDGTVINCLCKTCAECFSTKCSHSDLERALVGVYMVSEIEFALDIGYKIMHIYEIHYYKEFDFLLQEFIKKVNYLKTKYSNCLQNCNSLDDKEKYCEFLNLKMKLNEPNFQLKVGNCQDNKQKRNFYKQI